MTVPVDIIKIDKSFIDRLALGEPSLAIVDGLSDIARKLDIRVIAEGLESKCRQVLLPMSAASLARATYSRRPSPARSEQAC
ncbi:EAL domain-containing protein [Bosea sp. TAB14]|uniref:EAL domain-containing protein n=1 Tax=Bosea sp. TAB14 TaxID=3237481 RepID=UPI003F913848